MSTDATVKETWPETWPIPEDGQVVQRFLQSGFDFWLSVDSESRTRSLLLGMTDSRIKIPDSLPQSQGFSMQVLQISLPGPEFAKSALEIRLIDPDVSDLFDALVSDVARSANQQPDQRRAVSEVINRVNRWKELLDDLPSDGLGRGSQIGLYGELWFLNRFAVPAWGAAAAIAAWYGPERTNQDFQRGACAIEVKSTTSVEATSIPISNIRQLDDGPFEDLLLSHIILDRLEGVGETLPELVESTRIIARNEGAGGLFEERLLASKYHDANREDYDKFGYTLRRNVVYRVSGGFPRIMDTDLRNGVENVRYSIDRMVIGPSEIEESRVRELLEDYI